MKKNGLKIGNLMYPDHLQNYRLSVDFHNFGAILTEWNGSYLWVSGYFLYGEHMEWNDLKLGMLVYPGNRQHNWLDLVMICSQRKNNLT